MTTFGKISIVSILLLGGIWTAPAAAQLKEVPKKSQSCMLVTKPSQHYLKLVSQSLEIAQEKIKFVRTIQSEKFGCGYLVSTTKGGFYCQISSISSEGSNLMADSTFSSVYCQRE